MDEGSACPAMAADVAGAVKFVPVASLGTRYARLRPGRLPAHTTTMAELPLRVAEVTAGRYEVLDGHKRLAAWRAQGHTQVPVVVEPVASAVDHKRRLLAANAPPRTLMLRGGVTAGAGRKIARGW